MTRTLLFLILILAAYVANAQPAGPAATVDSLMAPFSRSDTPGGVVTVVRNGEVIFMRGYGMASLEQRTAITEGTIFDIGSVAKQFTGFALALLEGEGALDLDDDIRIHLPEVPDFGTTITIRNLLNHTSGLREIYDAKALAGWQGGDGIEQREALSVTAAMRELNFEPGTEYLYCNTAYMLLADIVSGVSGEPFPEWMEAHVFGPLGMENTEIMDVLGEVIPGAADSYSPLETGGFRRVFDNSSAYGQGGVYTNASDMVKWLANFGSMEVGGLATQERTRTRGVLASGDTLNYALGINVTEFRGQPVLRHGGASAGFRSGMAYFTALDAGVFVQSNRPGLPPAMVNQVAVAFFPEAFSAPPEREPRPEIPHQEFQPGPLEDYAGRYFSEEIEAAYTVRVTGGELEVVHWRQGPTRLEPIALDQFRANWGEITFERNVSGDVTGFRVSTGRVRGLLFGRIAVTGEGG
jgi:CubicO group peptidase (beta-lactamase class C family)